MSYEQALDAAGPVEWFGPDRWDVDPLAIWILGYWRQTLPVPYKRNKRRY